MVLWGISANGLYYPLPLYPMKESQTGDLSEIGLFREVHAAKEGLEAGVGAEGEGEAEGGSMFSDNSAKTQIRFIPPFFGVLNVEDC